MKIALVFDEWRNLQGKPLHGIKPELYFGAFHSGTTFPGEIELPLDLEEELTENMNNGFIPVFWIGKP